MDEISFDSTEDINEIYFRNDDNGYLVAAGKCHYPTTRAGTCRKPGSIAAVNSEPGRRIFEHSVSDKKHGTLSARFSSMSVADDVVVDSLMMRTEDGGDTLAANIPATKKELFHLDFNGNSQVGL